MFYWSLQLQPPQVKSALRIHFHLPHSFEFVAPVHMVSVEKLAPLFFSSSSVQSSSSRIDKGIHSPARFPRPQFCLSSVENQCTARKRKRVTPPPLLSSNPVPSQTPVGVVPPPKAVLVPWLVPIQRRGTFLLHLHFSVPRASLVSYLSAHPPVCLSLLSVCPSISQSSRPSQARSRSLYFLRRTDTWSLKSTGSRRNCECTRGM